MQSSQPFGLVVSIARFFTCCNLSNLIGQLQASERTLDAPDILDDYYLNLLDWGSSNVLAIALGTTVYLWDASNGSTSELVTVDDDKGPVTSVNWAPDGRHIAVGLNNSEVQLWDSTANRQVLLTFCSVGNKHHSIYYHFTRAAEDFKGWPPSSCWFIGMEQPPPFHWINGWPNYQQ